MTKLLIGTTLLNQFRIENFVASGGMATLYRVWDLRRGVPLAMKVLHPELASNPVFIAHFQHEARALEALSHPHIVPFYGMYKAGDLTFLLQQYIDGASLDEVLRRASGAPMSLRDVLTYFKALYTSLGYAHSQGIIHCDVKPANVLIDQGGQVYLSDFGIARHVEASMATFASGTPIYMAPEQIRGERLRPETDIYSLGMMLYEMLTGHRPFHLEGEFPPEVGTSQSDRFLCAHLHLLPVDPREFNPALPLGVARVLLKALAKDPQDRYPNMQAMAEALFAAVATRYEALPERVRLPDDLTGGVQSPENPVEDAADIQIPERHNFLEPVVPDRPQVPQKRRPLMPLKIAVSVAAGLIVVVCLLAGLRIVQSMLARAQGAVGDALINTPQATQTSLPSQVPVVEPVATQTQEVIETASTPPDESGVEEIGGKFVFVQREAGRDALFLLDIGSGEMQALASMPGAEWSWAPQWSPDGRQIVWVSRYANRSHILILDVASQQLRQIDAGEQYEQVHSPSWLQDGQRLSFWAAGSGKNWLVIADAASGSVVEATPLRGYRNLFVWNWSTGWVAFAQQKAGVYEVAVSASSDTVEHVLQPGSEGYAPAWSRDGQWLAFQGSSDGGPSEIWVARADGTEMRQATSGPGEGDWSRAPTWSPDGKYLGFVSNQAGSAGADLGELFIVDLATGSLRQVTATGGLVYDWRPDWKPE